MTLQSILVQKIAYTSIYDIIMSPELFEIQNKKLRLAVKVLINTVRTNHSSLFNDSNLLHIRTIIIVHYPYASS